MWNRVFYTAKYIEMLRSFHFVRCAWYQSKDHASMGPYWQNRTQEATSRSCQYCGTQGGGHPNYSCIWTQRRQTWTACGTHHVILQGTVTLSVFFFFFMQRRKKDSFKIILKFVYIYRPSTVKIIFLGWEETHFQKFTDVCYHRGFEFQTKLVIWKSMHPLTDASHSSHTVLTVVN